jgi:hypothetical protein
MSPATIASRRQIRASKSASKDSYKLPGEDHHAIEFHAKRRGSTVERVVDIRSIPGDLLFEPDL